MKSSFKILCLSLLFIFGAKTVQAQTAPDQAKENKERKQRGERGDRADLTPVQMADQHTERLAKTVTLTNEQLTKVKAVNLEYANKMAAAKPQSGEDRKQSRTAHEALRTEQEAAINKILTKEQVEEMKAKRGDLKGGKKGEGRGERGK